MKGHPKNGVFSIIRWIYWNSRIFGHFPFSVEYDVKYKLSKAHVTILDWLWFILTVFIYGSMITFNLIQVHNAFSQSSVDQVVSTFNIIGQNMLAITSIIMDMWNRKSIWKFVNDLNEFDEKVSQW